MDQRERLLAVDAVRGIAMFFIGVSHISFYVINDSGTLASDLRAVMDRGGGLRVRLPVRAVLASSFQLAEGPGCAAVFDQ